MTLRDPVTKEPGPHAIPVSKPSTMWILPHNIFRTLNKMSFSKLNSRTIFQKYPVEGSSRFLWVGSGSERTDSLWGRLVGHRCPTLTAGKRAVTRVHTLRPPTEVLTRAYTSNNPKSVNTQMEKGLDRERAPRPSRPARSDSFSPRSAPASKGCVWKADEGLPAPGFTCIPKASPAQSYARSHACCVWWHSCDSTRATRNVSTIYPRGVCTCTSMLPATVRDVWCSSHPWEETSDLTASVKKIFLKSICSKPVG